MNIKTIIVATLCSLTTAATMAQEVPSISETTINKETTIIQTTYSDYLFFQYKSEATLQELLPFGGNDAASRRAKVMEQMYDLLDWQHINKVLMDIFCSTFTDEQIKSMCDRKDRIKGVVRCYVVYDNDGNIIKTMVSVNNTPEYRAIPIAAYDEFMRKIRNSIQLVVEDKTYPYWLYAFDVDIEHGAVPKSTKR